MARLLFLAGAAVAVAAAPISVIAQQQGRVTRDGGDARRLTTSVGIESFPRFSPDGRTVAFTGEYAGNQDVYVVPAEGGEPRRLTWHPGADVVRGWTHDGRRVVFASGRATKAPGAVPKLWTVSAEGGLPEALPMPTANRGQFSPDGRRFVYQAITQSDVEWRGYRGGQAQPIRIVDLGADLAMTKVPWNGSNDTDPAWLGDKVYFLSDRDNAANVWSYDAATRQVVQVTRFRDFDAKHLSAGGGALVFEQGGYVHLYDPAAQRDRRVTIRVRGDMPWARTQWKDVSRFIQRGSLSPTGARALFEARGDVFTVGGGERGCRAGHRGRDHATRRGGGSRPAARACHPGGAAAPAGEPGAAGRRAAAAGAGAEAGELR